MVKSRRNICHRWWFALPLILLLLAADFHTADASTRKRKRQRRSVAAKTVVAKTVSPAERRLREYIDSVAAPLDPRINHALRRIGVTPRRLLALKYYLGRLPEIDSIWAWTAEEARAYRKTEEYGHAIAEVTRVRNVFDSLYPGYSLKAPMEIRSLEAQLRLEQRPFGGGGGRFLVRQLHGDDGRHHIPIWQRRRHPGRAVSGVFGGVGNAGCANGGGAWVVAAWAVAGVRFPHLSPPATDCRGHGGNHRTGVGFFGMDRKIESGRCPCQQPFLRPAPESLRAVALHLHSIGPAARRTTRGRQRCNPFHPSNPIRPQRAEAG